MRVQLPPDRSEFYGRMQWTFTSSGTASPKGLGLRSNDQERVAGKGLTIEEALEEAKRNGELDPCITRVFRGMIL